MRVLFVMQLFEPEPALKGLALAAGLRARGHDVEVITGFPNYPGGKIYPGYRQRILERYIDDSGVRIARVPQFFSHDSSAARRIVTYASFAASALLYGMHAARSADIVYVSQPPVAIGLSATLIGFLHGVPFVYDVQDLWPDSVLATGMICNKSVLRAIDLICNLIYQRAARVVVLSEGMKRELFARGVSHDKIDVIYNWCHEQVLVRASGSAEVPQEMIGRFNVVFAGNLGRAQGLSAVVHAANLVRKSNSKVQFVFIGDGLELESLKTLAAGIGANNVVFLPRRPMSEMEPILRMADVLLVHLKNDPLFAMTIPSKVQAYLAMGRPLLVAVRGDAAELVQRAGAGIVVEPENVSEIANAVFRFAASGPEALEAMGQAGEKFYWRELSQEAGIRRTANVLEEAVKHARRRGNEASA